MPAADPKNESDMENALMDKLLITPGSDAWKFLPQLNQQSKEKIIDVNTEEWAPISNLWLKADELPTGFQFASGRITITNDQISLDEERLRIRTRAECQYMFGARRDANGSESFSRQICVLLR